MMDSNKRPCQVDLILGTREERIKLLKAGFAGKEIEMLYIKNNGFKIVLFSIPIEQVDFEIPEKKCMAREMVSVIA
ncbi:MAG: hypothetical protein O8C66_10440 [Candidatus Methanoperedens sp.]|nr:hypothetical protein [Candidatus Methanoperedens sp.]MCZ7370915.1 hypothetical protein [Candidatus Methanoperedens sp.]